MTDERIAEIRRYIGDQRFDHNLTACKIISECLAGIEALRKAHGTLVAYIENLGEREITNEVYAAMCLNAMNKTPELPRPNREDKGPQECTCKYFTREILLDTFTAINWEPCRLHDPPEEKQMQQRLVTR
jgi:hypothetical protein